MRKSVLAGLVFGLMAGSAAFAGEAKETVKAVEGDTPEAYVTDVAFIEASETGAKIYSTAGGDPAINGLYTFLAIAGEAPGDGWTVFQIGDFNSWEIAEQAADHVVLKVSRSWVDQASGEIKTVEEKLSVPLVAPGTRELTVTKLP
jgi:hypothetical protein